MNKPICKICLKEFDNWIIFDRHILAVHNKVRVFECIKCGEKCKGVDKFDQHLEFTHGTNHWTLNLAMKNAWRDFEKMRIEL